MVLHFFDGALIEKSVSQLFLSLKPGGKLFIVADTPYIKPFQGFIPIYEKLKKDGAQWPGLISDLASYVPSRAPNLPGMFHALDPEVLSRVLVGAGFRIEKFGIFAQTRYPEDIQLDGREGVGCVAVRE